MPLGLKILIAVMAVSLFGFGPLQAQPFHPPLLTAAQKAGLDQAAGAYGRADYAAALRIWRQLADQGNASAQNSLGQMYLQGKGVPQDYTQAVSWHRKAAEQGAALAQFTLGSMYEGGIVGLEPDYVQAHKWYNLAAARGDPWGAAWRDELAKKMTHAQIAEAQRLAREWKPK